MSGRSAADLRALWSLDGQVALVTGAGGSLGREMALILAAAGAQVVLAGRTLKSLEVTKDGITEAGGKAFCVRMDVADGASIVAALDEAGGRADPVNILVNNAGTNVPKAALDLADAEWDQIHDTNLRGCFLLARECARRMKDAQMGGAIVNIASVLGVRTQKMVSAYMAAKAGLVHLTRALALEWAPYNIRVNALLPGYFNSELTEAFLASEPGKQLVRRIPQRRLASPAELAGPLLLLAGRASSYVTGSALVVDGGLSVASI
jgi:NAD(P)-dependent dehydrogenase (short-subunit alcohol dehydrogenase family)